jgi:hypothetical protein
VTKKHFIIHFEPMDIWADNADNAKDILYEKLYTNDEFPSISKVIPAMLSFDKDDIETVKKAQRMFPNCEKYEKCCTEEKQFWDTVNEKIKATKPRKQPFRIKNIHLNFTKPPKGF